MKRNLILITLALLVLSLAAWAQTGTVTGIITDEQSNPVENARVMLRAVGGGCGNCEVTYTGEDGSYTFEEVEVGDYFIKAMKCHVGRGTSDEFEVEENVTVVINVELEEHGCGGGGGGGGGGCHGGGGGGH